MRKIVVPREIFLAEIRAGRVTVSGEGLRAAGGAAGIVGSAAGAMAERRAVKKLEEASESPDEGIELAFPPGCCNCLRDGMNVRSIPMSCVYSRGVEYTFRFRVPHCRDCMATAHRKRPGFIGMLAAFIAIAVPLFIFFLGWGSLTNNNTVILASLVVAPAAGVGLPRLWMKLPRPSSGRASRYQAVCVTSIDFDMLGRPSDFTLGFENSEYADRFMALNEKHGVSEV